MKRLLPLGWVLFTALCLLPNVPGPAGAFVLEGPQVLELMARQQKKLKGLRVVQTLVVHGGSPEGPSAEFAETIIYRFPDRFRSDLAGQGRQRLHVVNRDASLTVTDGVLTAEAETAADRYKDLLLHRERVRLQNHLIRLGVDLSVTSFGRLEMETAFVIGARYPDFSAPQVWIEQRSFRPMRLILPAAPDSWEDPALDIRFQNWRETNAVWYPWHILFYRGDRLERELKISRVEKDPSLPADFFDLGQLKRRYQAATTAAPVSEQPPSGGDVQKTLDDFKKIFD
ncbi:MAG: hypothetical protein LJE63_15570 [Desulfobacteraceae bacterium]|nr:hypothetical protein [Desulfobacteraceae bacterium]